MSRCHNRRKGGNPRKKSKGKAKKLKMSIRVVEMPAMPAAPLSPTTEEPIVVMSGDAARKIVALVEGDPNHECGAFLIGNLCKDRITGTVIAFVDDIYTDGAYGSGSDYEFTVDTQIACLRYVERNHEGRMHVFGTVHSHANHPAFFSGTDYMMMNSRRVDEVHMVISPRYGEYVLTYKNKDGEYNHSAVLQTDETFFRFARKRLQGGEANAY